MGGLIVVLFLSSAFLGALVVAGAIAESWDKVRHTPALVKAFGFRMTVGILFCKECRPSHLGYHRCYIHRMSRMGHGQG